MATNGLEEHAASIFDRHQCFEKYAQATLKMEAESSTRILVSTHILLDQLIYIHFDDYILLNARKG
jgi:hypothetical protein